jgi:hypothetical protein
MKVKALKSFTYSHITPEYRTRKATIGKIIDDFPESLRHLIKKKYVKEIKAGIKTETDTGVSKLVPAPDIPKKESPEKDN